TGALSVGEVATAILAETGAWPPAERAEPPNPPPTDDPANGDGGEILWLTGATGAGKSTVGFRAYREVLAAGWAAAYVDAGQLGFFGSGPGDHALQARNLAALWRNFHAAGARAAVVTGRVLSGAVASLYARALPDARLSWRRLRVGEVELTRRI